MSVVPGPPPVVCPICRTEAPPRKLACLKCGTRLDVFRAPAGQPSGTDISHEQKSRFIAILLCCVGFLGIAGLHRFYTEKNSTGIAMLLTFGGAFFWTMYDLHNLIEGDFVDERGLPLR
jgi:hypothetical protein